MSKRRINKQQFARIKKTQQNYHNTISQNNNTLLSGLVISRYGKYVEIEDSQGQCFICTTRPTLETLVAGDKVIWQIEGQRQGVIVSLYPRNSLLAKPTQSGLKKPVAANMTQLIVVIAPKPEISWPLLDSYLLIAETLKLHAIIILNKVDLPCDLIKNELTSIYQPLDYPIIWLSHDQQANEELLQKTLNHQISVFVGQSGVGKSSLISRILPHEKNIATNRISENSELGKHTTSNSRFYHIPSGGGLIDSPGVREFSLWLMNSSAIAKGYKEFQPYLTQCKYRNCSHIDTPHCAILSAIARGEISATRYENFVKLAIQYENHLKY